MQRFRHRIEDACPVGRELRQPRHHLQQGLAIALHQGRQHGADLGTVHRAQHGAHALLAQRTTGVGDGLVEQRQAVAQRAVGGARELGDGGRIGLDGFRTQDLRHLPADLFLVQALEVELQAARQHGDRQLLRVGGGEQELDVFRRLLQRLQQRVERRFRQHVHFVDQIDLVLAARGHVLRVLDHFAHIVHTGVRGSVDLQQIDIAAGIDVQAGRALAAGIGTGALLAVQRFGEDAGDGGLAHAARTREQEGMVNAAAVQRIGERADHVFLADQLCESLGTPLAGEDEIGHAAIVPRCASPSSRRGPLAGFACGAPPAGARIHAPESGRKPRSGPGEVSEWLKEHAWKVCKRLNRASGVRIPLSPPVVASPRIQCGFRRKSRAVQDAAWFPWWPRRPLATLGRKSRQGRKAATVSIDAGAEVSRRGHRLFGHSHSLMPAVATASFPAHRMNPGARQQRYRSTRTPRSAGGVTAFSGTGHSLMPAATALLPMPRNRRTTRPADGSNPSPR